MSLVLTEKRALLILEPRIASSQNVLSYSISSSGRYIVAVQEVPLEIPLELGVQPPQPKAKKLVVWDSLTGGTKEVALPKDARMDRITVDWFPTVDKALVFFSEEIYSYTPQSNGLRTMDFKQIRTYQILDPTSAQMREVHRDEGAQLAIARIFVSPIRPFALRVVTTRPFALTETGPITPSSTVIQRLEINGSFGPVTKLPDEYVDVAEASWSADGQTFQLVAGKIPEGGGHVDPRIILFNPSNGSISDIVGPVATFEPPATVSDVELFREVTPLSTYPDTRSVQTWWLRALVESETPRALVTEHGLGVRMPPNEAYVSFVSNGTLFTRQVLPISIERYREMRNASARTEAINRAKQVALGIMMFAADWDGQVSGGIDLQKEIGPYLKNDSLLQGFTLVWQGGNLFDVKDPTTTVLGYTDGPGGRAVAYLDGHVRWEKTGGG